MEKITVVIPFYNVEAYIGECLDSLEAQTYSNLEILCVDDRSPDSTREIAESHARKDQRIRIISHSENKGLGSARNTGINNATGKYICFVDSDDYVSTTFIDSLYKAITTNESDISICGLWCFEGNSRRKCHFDYNDETINIDKNKKNVLTIVDRYRSSTCIKMYKLELLKNKKIFQPEQRYYEDVIFWLKAACFSQRISVISDRLYYYRQRPNSIMTSLTFKHVDDRIYLIKQIDEFTQKYLPYEKHTEKTSAITSLKEYLLKHIEHGYALIQDSDQNSTRLDEYYTEQIINFSKDYDWPDIHYIYNSDNALQAFYKLIKRYLKILNYAINKHSD